MKLEFLVTINARRADAPGLEENSSDVWTSAKREPSPSSAADFTRENERSSEREPKSMVEQINAWMERRPGWTMEEREIRSGDELRPVYFVSYNRYRGGGSPVESETFAWLDLRQGTLKLVAPPIVDEIPGYRRELQDFVNYVSRFVAPARQRILW